MQKTPNIVVGPMALYKLREYLYLSKFQTIGIVDDPLLRELFGERLDRFIPNEMVVIKIDGTKLKKTGGHYVWPLDCVIGFGGGTNIDQAKMIAKMSGSVLVIVPTKPTAAIASTVASISTSDGRATIPTPTMEEIYIDTEITVPTELLLSECGDMLSSWSAVPDAMLANMRGVDPANIELLREAYLRGYKIMNIVEVQQATSILSLYDLSIEIGVIGDMYGSTRPSSGTEHKISHALDQTLPDERHSMHGVQVSLGVLCSLYLQRENQDLMLALRENGIEPLDPLILKDYLQRLNLPVCFEDLGIGRAEACEILKLARTIRPEARYTILDEYSDLDVIEILSKYSIL